MNDQSYELAFQIILYAGNSRSASMMGIEAAREFNFDQATNFIKEAKNELSKAHALQTQIIQEEAKGNKKDANIILVHAQDHLTMAIMARDNAEEFINLYSILHKLTKYNK